jgi:hypothetical protein
VDDRERKKRFILLVKRGLRGYSWLDTEKASKQPFPKKKGPAIQAFICLNG